MCVLLHFGEKRNGSNYSNRYKTNIHKVRRCTPLVSVCHLERRDFFFFSMHLLLNPHVSNSMCYLQVLPVSIWLL